MIVRTYTIFVSSEDEEHQVEVFNRIIDQIKEGVTGACCNNENYSYGFTVMQANIDTGEHE